MEPMKPDLSELEHQRDRLRSSLARVGDLRPGSLVQRHHKCGKPNCHCARKDSPGHGPTWVLTRAVEGKTVTKGIPAGPALQKTREQIEECRRFRSLVRQFLEMSEKLCDTRIQDARAASKPVAEKGGSKARSKRKSPKRSKRS